MTQLAIPDAAVIQWAQAALRLEKVTPSVLFDLANLCRSVGAIREAIQLLDRAILLSPASAATVAERLRDTLSGRAKWEQPDEHDAAPTPFIRVEDFLPPPEHSAILQLAKECRALEAAGVNMNGKGLVDEAVRIASILKDPGRFREIFWPFFDAFITSDALALAHSIDPSKLQLLQLDVTAYGNGGFYRPHRDNGTRYTKRRISFIYYFHAEPKRLKGGALLLWDGNPEPETMAKATLTKLPCLQNSLVFFPSGCLHAVEPVTTESAAIADSRFTINGWLGWS